MKYNIVHFSREIKDIFNKTFEYPLYIQRNKEVIIWDKSPPCRSHFLEHSVHKVVFALDSEQKCMLKSLVTFLPACYGVCLQVIQPFLKFSFFLANKESLNASFNLEKSL